MTAGSDSRRIDVGRSLPRAALQRAPWRARAGVSWLLAAGDASVLVGAMLVAGLLGGHPWQQEIPKLLALLAAPIIAVYIVGGYRLESLRRIAAVLIAAGAAVAAGVLAWTLAKTLWIKGWIPLYDSAGVGIVLVLLAVHGAWVAASRDQVRRWCRRREAGARVLAVAGAESGRAICAWYAQGNRGNPLALALVGGEIPSAPPAGATEVAAIAELPRLLDGPIACVVLATPWASLPAAAQGELVHARLGGVPVMTPSAWIEEWWGRTPVRFDDPTWLLHEEVLGHVRSPWYAGAKRLCDLGLASLLLAGLSPLLLLTAVLVKATSRGPVLFTQVRVGAMKRPFTILKFRTMRLDAEKDGARWASANDSRATPIGRLLRRSRIDELPQLWNVIAGDMSLVGPRPERPEFTAQLEQQIPWYDLRHLVRPGITGWAQVCHPYGASVEDAVAKLEFEIFYLRHASLGFDLAIMARSIGIVLGLRGR